MSSINPLLHVNPLASTSGTSGTSSTSNPLSMLASNSNAFLQLLVAQLKYQDPLNPVSGTQFMSQTAQMMEASEITQMVQTVNKEEASLQTSTAASMIGRTVTVTDPSGSPVTGNVDSVSVNPTNGPSLSIGGKSYPLSAVTKIQ